MQNKIKSTKYVSNDMKEIKKLIIILLIVIVCGVGLYFLTNVLSKKEEKVSNVEFDYSTITVGSVFNRPYNEYFVFLFSSDDEKASGYDNLVTSYTAKEDAKKVFIVDTKLAFNSFVNSDTPNKKPTNSSEIRINESALLLIKDGKVEKYYEGAEEYQNVLK